MKSTPTVNTQKRQSFIVAGLSVCVFLHCEPTELSLHHPLHLHTEAEHLLTSIFTGYALFSSDLWFWSILTHGYALMETFQ